MSEKANSNMTIGMNRASTLSHAQYLNVRRKVATMNICEMVIYLAPEGTHAKIFEKAYMSKEKLNRGSSHDSIFLLRLNMI